MSLATEESSIQQNLASSRACDASAQGEVVGAGPPASASHAAAEAPEEINEVLAAARADHRNSSKLLAMRSDSARLDLPWAGHEDQTAHHQREA